MSDPRLRPATVARTVLVALGLIALALLLWAGRNVFFVLFFGILVGVLLSVFTDPLEKAGLPRIPALMLVLVVLLGLLVGAWFLLWPTVQPQLATIGRDLPDAAEEVWTWVASQYEAITGAATPEDPDLEEQIRGRLSQQAGAILGGAMPIINSALGAAAGFLVVLVVGIYTAASPGVYRRGLERLVPPRHRPRTRETIDRTGSALRRWLVGTLVNMILVGALTGIGLWILGIPAFIALGVIAGILEFVPIVGPILASIPAIAVGFTVSPMTAVWVMLLFVAIQQLESNVITPLVMRGAVHLPPALTVLFQSLMALVFGFLGLLLAVPILAAAMVMTKTLYVEPMERKQEEPRPA